MTINSFAGNEAASSDWMLAHLATVVQNSDDAIVSKSLEGMITGWNPAAEKIFGYTPQEVIGGPISILIPPDRAAEEAEILDRVRRGENTALLETSRIRKDGRRIEIRLTMSPVKDSQGRVIGVSAIARDITEQKLQAERNHLETERLQATLTSIGDAVIVTDQRGLVQFLNPAAEGLTQWKQEEAKGKPLEFVFEIINETNRQRVENPVYQVMREGLVVGLANHTLLIGRNGTEVAIADSAAPIRSRNGVTSGVVLVFRDVSAMRAVENVRARLSAIVEGSDDAIISKDLDGRITTWNKGAESIFGYSQEEAVGRPITILIPPDRLSEEADILRRLRRGDRVNDFETIRITKNRQRVPVSLTISPIYDAAGKVVGASKIARNISDQKEAERQLEAAHVQLKSHADDLERQVSDRTAELKQSLEELETFSSGLSHDLKTPLRAIAGCTQMLQEDFANQLPPEAGDLLDRISQTCGRLGRFVDNVLSYARLRNEVIALERVELSLLIVRVIAEYPHANQANAEVTVEEPLLPVEAHEGLVTQAISNLVSNGVKYVAPNVRPKLRIWTEARGEAVRLWVEDNGIGIAKADQEKVFELFTRLPETASYAGTGVGLAVVKQAVRRMGGTVGVESAKGQGSRFWLELKAAGKATKDSSVGSPPGHRAENAAAPTTPTQTAVRVFTSAAPGSPTSKTPEIPPESEPRHS